MKLFELFDTDLLTRRLADGYVRRQVHPTARLAILNYSEKAQYEMQWDDVTEQCRGLIYNVETLEIVARPFRKFHNWDAMGTWLPSGPCTVAEKFDGSLGITYWNPEAGAYHIATRGSFASEQAIRGTLMLGEMDAQGIWNDKEWDSRLTPLFEIVYPENRIVCDYGSFEGLVLLDVIDIETGRADMVAFDAMNWPIKAERRLASEFTHAFAHDIREGEEGFVIYWPHHDHRVKMKSADYVALHRIVTGLNERTVWSAFGPDGNGVSVQKFCEPLPDEFHPWVQDVVMRLKTDQTEILRVVHDAFIGVKAQLYADGRAEFTRREFAQLATKTPYPGYMFLLLDGKEQQLKEKIWDSLKPEGNQYAKQMSEDVA